MSNLNLNASDQAIHNDSIRLGGLVTSSWSTYKADPTSDNRQTFDANLYQYIGLRQQLPRQSDGNHVGSTPAYNSTQGLTS